jgi:hypothetical protein
MKNIIPEHNNIGLYSIICSLSIKDIRKDFTQLSFPKFIRTTVLLNSEMYYTPTT